MIKLRSIIIDDETHCVETLSWQIEKYCPEINLVGTYNSPTEGLKAVETLNPDLVFLDIDMPEMTGFDLLNQLDEINFSIIFTTGYDQFAVKAFKVSALDYLIKPIDDEELKSAVKKAVKKANRGHEMADPIEHLLQQIKDKKLSERVVFPTMEGLEFVPTETIIHCESDSNYTIVHFDDRNKMVISKTLKEVAEILTDERFFRVHNSHLVNLNYVTKYVKGDGGHLTMGNGAVIPVSRSRKQELLDFIKA